MAQRTIVRTSGPLSGEIRVPGDKSISHRAVMFAGIAEGVSRISNFLDGGDCRATVSVMRRLSVAVDGKNLTELLVKGNGLSGLTAAPEPLDCRSSGTTMRLAAGILAGQSFDSVLTGSEQLLRRPMNRITKPLEMMGVTISSRNGLAPLAIRGRGTSSSCLTGIDYSMPVASAQVKSCLLLAGLYADRPTTVRGGGTSRDHTERMLNAMGARIVSEENSVTVEPQQGPLRPLEIAVPGDASSAAFLIAAASIVPGSDILVRGVGLNPTRTGAINALLRMGAMIEIKNEKIEGGEPIGDVAVKYAELGGTDISGEEIAAMIDELPIIAAVAAVARGKTSVRDAADLKAKETDRIASTATELGKLGARIAQLNDGFIIEGGTALKGADVDSQEDHRLAMMLIVAGLAAKGETIVHGSDSAADSFPGFESCLASLGAPLTVEEN